MNFKIKPFNGIMTRRRYPLMILDDAYSRTGGIFVRDTAQGTAYSLWFNEVWPYASLNHNEYAVSRAVFSMKMPPVREYASSLLINQSRNHRCSLINRLSTRRPWQSRRVTRVRWSIVRYYNNNRRSPDFERFVFLWQSGILES